MGHIPDTYLGKYHANHLELLIMSYFSVVKREMIDMVPKAITLTLVNFAKENLQRELLENLYKPDVLEELLKESPDVVARWVSTSALQKYQQNSGCDCYCIEIPPYMIARADIADVENASRWSGRSIRRRLSLLLYERPGRMHC